MKNCAIVCEYNPFHSGHKYQLDRARQLGADNIFCVMSGEFVQAGEPAFCDKAIRAECAVLGGADAVIQLPTVFSTASAQYFAAGAVGIISEIKDIAFMAMGATAKADMILALADIKISHKHKFEISLKSELSTGKSYNAATAAALERIYDELYGASASEALSDPNGILCIEYITAINRFAPRIQPVIIPRVSSQYNDTATDGEYISATAIRNNPLDKVKKFIPYKYDDICRFRTEHLPDMNAYKKLALYAIKAMPTESIAELRDCSEGMEYLLKNMRKAATYDDISAQAAGKRYGKKRINRLFADAVLGIKRRDISHNPVTRLLACAERFDFSTLPQCVKTNNADIKSVYISGKDMDVYSLEIDERAAKLYNILCGLPNDYYNYSLIKV